MMNEQIRDLMEKSMVLTGVEGLGGSYQELDPVKFANLIVKECIDQIKRVGILEDIENETDMVADAVKEHFGVE
jgi:hypothetical protein